MQTHEAFDARPKLRKNPLPINPERASGDRAVGLGRFPSWLHRKLPKGKNLLETSQAIEGNRLHTVCEEAKCPNLLECWTKKTATFLAMGKACTRACGFCDIDFAKQPPALEADEPARIADSVKKLGLKHVVITQVARDDLSDGGAQHIADIVQEIRNECPSATVELLTSDFHGNKDAWDVVLGSEPEVFNYNIETVRRLTPRVRHKATYDRTLEFLSYARERRGDKAVKSGIMVGLGETEEEVQETIRDLFEAGCNIITIGQYLQANKNKLRVKEFVTPQTFNSYAAYGKALSIKHMYCGPFVRSSYNADLFVS